MWLKKNNYCTLVAGAVGLVLTRKALFCFIKLLGIWKILDSDNIKATWLKEHGVENPDFLGDL